MLNEKYEFGNPLKNILIDINDINDINGENNRPLAKSKEIC